MKRDNYYYDDEDFEGENLYLTPQEVMSLLWIGRNSFYKLVNSGELPAFRVGKQWRVSREALVEFAKRR